MSHEYKHALAKVLDAAAAGDKGPGPLSTGEALMAALALNRPDWLARMGYTIVEALERIGEEWRQLLPEVARAAANEQSRQQEARELADQALAITQLQASGASIEQEIFCAAALVTCGSAPGYRDASLIFDLDVELQYVIPAWTCSRASAARAGSTGSCEHAAAFRRPRRS